VSEPAQSAAAQAPPKPIEGTGRFTSLAGDRADGRLTSGASLLAVMAAINFVNYMDRAIIGPLLTHLEAPIAQGGLALEPRETGLLGSAFMLVHSIASIPLGILAGYVLRKHIIAVGVALWSVATAGAALARSFTQLFIARALVGIGEAAYAPAATALISDRFLPEHRSRAMGVFNLGMFLGGAVGLGLGAPLAQHLGWRSAFFVAGLPGLVLAVLVLFLAEKRRRGGKTSVEGHPSTAITHAPPAFRDVKPLLRSRAFLAVNAVGILITFFVGALQFYAVRYLEQVHGIPGHESGPRFGFIAAVAGLLGVGAGSYLADRLTRRGWGSAGRLVVIGGGMVCATPFVVLGLLVGDRAVLYPSLFLGVFFTVWYIGPILAALHDVVVPRLRAAATGLYFFLIHMLGDALSPALVGEIRAQTGSLRPGMLVSVAVGAAGGALAIVVAWRMRRRPLAADAVR
jgi:MFS family permease